MKSVGGPDYLLSGRRSRRRSPINIHVKNFLSADNRGIQSLMPKRRIIDLPGQSHFLTFSTYQRRRFLDSGETRDIVLEVLEKCLIAHQGRCEGFVVMPDHVHALLFGGEDFSISLFVQSWKKTSSYRIKRFFARELSRYEQLCPEGCPIWQARFYDFNLLGPIPRSLLRLVFSGGPDNLLVRVAAGDGKRIGGLRTKHRFLRATRARATK